MMRFLPLVLAVLLFGFLFKGLYLNHRGTSDARVGQTIAKLSLTTLDGQSIDFSSGFKQPLILVHVWASWCSTCLAEMSQWQQMLEAVSNQSVARVGVVYKDEAASARLWLKRYGNPYDQILMDPQGRLSMELGVYGTPETYLLTRSGRIVAKHIGPITQEQWQAKWLPLLQQGDLRAK